MAVAEPSLSWQSEHVFLSGRHNRTFVCSGASQEAVLLPAQLVTLGLWRLEFDDNDLAVCTYLPSGADSEPSCIEYAQSFFEFAAYKAADGSVTLRNKEGGQVLQRKLLQQNVEYTAKLQLPGAASDRISTDVCVMTHALPGRRVCWSLRALSAHLGWQRPGKRKWSSAVVYDRWATWQRMIDKLRFPSNCIRQGLRGRQAPAAGSPPAVEDATVTTAALLMILCKDAFGLRMTLHAGTEPSLAALNWLRAIISLLSGPNSFTVYLDAHFALDAAGRFSGGQACEVTIESTGRVLLHNMKMHAARVWPAGWGRATEKCMRLSQVPCELHLEECLRIFSSSPLSNISTFILSQLLWNVGMLVESTLLVDEQRLKKGATMMPQPVCLAEHDGRKGTQLQHRLLRYRAGGQRVTETTNIIGVGLDASRISGRSRIVQAGSTPLGYAWWLPTQVAGE